MMKWMRNGAVAISMVGLGLAVSLPAAGQTEAKHMDFHASVSPDGRRVVYYSYRAPEPDVFVADMSTGEETNITNSRDLWEIEPHWSPTGNRVAYSRGSSMADLQVVVHDLDTGIETTIDAGINVVWSPDGRRLAYAQAFGLRTANADGSDISVIDLGDLLGFKSEPAWSPDGTALYFTHQVENGGPSNTYRVDLETGEYRLAVDGKGMTITGPVVSPDGSTIFLSYQEPNSYPFIVSYDLALGGEFDFLTGGRAEYQYFPSLTPDGETLVVEAGSWNANTFYLYGFSLKDEPGEPVQITGPRGERD